MNKLLAYFLFLIYGKQILYFWSKNIYPLVKNSFRLFIQIYFFIKNINEYNILKMNPKISILHSLYALNF